MTTLSCVVGSRDASDTTPSSIPVWMRDRIRVRVRVTVRVRVGARFRVVGLQG